MEHILIINQGKEIHNPDKVNQAKDKDKDSPNQDKDKMENQETNKQPVINQVEILSKHY